MKKRWCTAFMFILASAVLSGCQPNTQTANAVTTAEEAAAVPMEETGLPDQSGAEITADEVKLTIVHTNDVHARVEVEPYVKALTAQLRESEENVILISAGDAFTGTPFASLSDGHNISKVMNDVGYEMFLFGNHEQNENETLREAIAELACPQLGANAPQHILEANPQIEKYVIREYNGIKVAFLGITTDDYAEPNIGEQWVAYMEQIKSEAETEGADVFVAVAHLGITADDPTKRSTYLAEHCPWLSVIIDGHCHTAHENGMLHNDVLIAETGEYGNNIGIVELTMKDGTVIDRSARLIPIAGNEEQCGIIPDESLKLMIAEIEAENNAFLSTVIAKLLIDLDGERQDVRTTDTNFGNLVADVMLYYADADVAVVPGWFLRCSVPQGDLTNEMFLTMFPSDQWMYTKDISGQELWEMMETALSFYPEASPNFLHIGGMRIEYDPEKNPSERIISIILNDGAAVDLAATYTYAYMYEKDIEGSLGIVNDLFVNYLTENGEMPGAEHRILQIRQEK